MKKILLFASLAMALMASCGKKAQTESEAQPTPAQALITRLDSLRQKGYMYAHQDDPFYGVTWQWERGRSDTYELVGDYPALMGFDLGGIEMGDAKNLDSVPFTWIREEAIKHVERGGIITFSWHPRNPRTGGTAWDVTDSTVVRNILPGGEQHEKPHSSKPLPIRMVPPYHSSSVLGTNTMVHGSGGAKNFALTMSTRHSSA